MNTATIMTVPADLKQDIPEMDQLQDEEHKLVKERMGLITNRFSYIETLKGLIEKKKDEINTVKDVTGEQKVRYRNEIKRLSTSKQKALIESVQQLTELDAKIKDVQRRKSVVVSRRTSLKDTIKDDLVHETRTLTDEVENEANAELRGEEPAIEEPNLQINDIEEEMSEITGIRDIGGTNEIQPRDDTTIGEYHSLSITKDQVETIENMFMDMQRCSSNKMKEKDEMIQRLQNEVLRLRDNQQHRGWRSEDISAIPHTEAMAVLLKRQVQRELLAKVAKKKDSTQSHRQIVNDFRLGALLHQKWNSVPKFIWFRWIIFFLLISAAVANIRVHLSDDTAEIAFDKKDDASIINEVAKMETPDKGEKLKQQESLWEEVDSLAMFWA